MSSTDTPHSNNNSSTPRSHGTQHLLFNKSHISRRSSIPRSSPLPAETLVSLFNSQIEYETFILGSERGTTTTNLSYQPLLGWENLDDVKNTCSTYSLFEIANRLDEITRAVKNWDIYMMMRILDNARFDTILETAIDSDAMFEDEMKKNIIKRMIMEHVSSMVSQVSDVPEIKEKETVLIILLHDV